MLLRLIEKRVRGLLSRSQSEAVFVEFQIFSAAALRSSQSNSRNLSISQPLTVSQCPGSPPSFQEFHKRQLDSGTAHDPWTSYCVAHYDDMESNISAAIYLAWTNPTLARPSKFSTVSVSRSIAKRLWSISVSLRSRRNLYSPITR